MKQRILFVDDDPLVLGGLQRMLRSMREQWDMVFVESGPQALELLEREPFDMVVSDMRMPVMSGAELLNEVMLRYPHMVRLILSGHADRDLILQCVGATHQYLSKPCDPELLKSTLLRAFTLGCGLQSEAVKGLVSRIEHLPSLPGTFVRLSRTLENPLATAQEVGSLVAQDVGLSALALKLVNSAFFGLRRQISSPEEAVVYLGLETVKSLALVQGVFGQAEIQRMKAAVRPELLLEHSLRVAQAARIIARTQRAEPKVADEAFVAGLLHDAGILLLASGFPEDYGKVLRLVEVEGLEMQVAEHMVFGAPHPQVGAYLLGLWGLPFPVVEAVAHHHSPASAGSFAFGALTAVHAAEALTDTPFDAANLDPNYLRVVGVEDRVEAWKEALDEHLPKEQTP